MVDSPRSVAVRKPRRSLLRMLTGSIIATGAGALAACTSNEPQDDAAGAGAQATADSADTAKAPDIIAAPLAVTGQTVEPVTGIRLTLPGEVQALTPERVGEGRAQVTYVWTNDDSDWGYLVVEGPNSFSASDQSAAMIAANAERQRLIAALITPSEPRKLEWEGFSQCVQMTWSQRTVPPGWSQETAVDAIALFCVVGEERAYTVVAYGPAGALEKTFAYAALCSAIVPESSADSEG